MIVELGRSLPTSVRDLLFVDYDRAHMNGLPGDGKKIKDSGQKPGNSFGTNPAIRNRSVSATGRLRRRLTLTVRFGHAVYMDITHTARRTSARRRARLQYLHGPTGLAKQSKDRRVSVVLRDRLISVEAEALPRADFVLARREFFVFRAVMCVQCW
ncbi:hypothetical protein GWI33_016120 [Rhynchophorus ferrugineus]|uniref:Uncharacterized protein n=1 Tax=Rhynchophorus ferrugineus TaxID=354439 RepID=A0A834M3P1_RHYFE|nr:hypothetical protein GWI33_016120 [Rhynchophorus ferrugineus]